LAPALVDATMRSLRFALATVVAGLITTAPAHAIVGGTNAPSGKYPWIADVTIDGQFGCTGSLIAPNVVLTAAHCGSLVPDGIVNVPVGAPGQLITVRVGAYRTDGSDGVQRTGTSVAVNPGWLGLLSVGHDVSLITLDQPVNAPTIQIANAAERALWAPGTMATIAGFGVTAENGNPPAVLQEAQVPIVADSVAAAAYPYTIPGVDQVQGGFEAQTQVGAGFPQGGVDSCQGDSGGPLLVPAPRGGMRLVGDTSYGNGCAQPGFPGIYGRLAGPTMSSWVASIVGGAIAPAPAGRAKLSRKHQVTRAERRRARRAPARFRAARARSSRTRLR
jgi:trypsin